MMNSLLKKKLIIVFAIFAVAVFSACSKTVPADDKQPSPTLVDPPAATLTDPADIAKMDIKYVKSVTVSVDGVTAAVSEKFYVYKVNGTPCRLFNAKELGKILKVKTFCEFDKPPENGTADATVGSITTYYENYILRLGSEEPFVSISKARSDQILSYTYTSPLIVLNGEYYISFETTAPLFFAMLEQSDGDVVNPLPELDFITLPAKIEQAKQFAKKKALSYVPTGDLMQDRAVLHNYVICRKDNSDYLYNMEFNELSMGPILGKLTYTDYGFVRSMLDNLGNTHYGLYSQPYGKVSLKMEFSEITCIDYKTRLFSIATGFGDGKRYGGAHIPLGIDQVTIIPATMRNPMTRTQMEAEFYRRGVPMEGFWKDSEFKLPLMKTENFRDFAYQTSPNLLSITFDRPLNWSDDGLSDDGNILYTWQNKPFAIDPKPTQKMASLHGAILVRDAIFKSHEADFYKEMLEIKNALVLYRERYALSDRTIYLIVEEGYTDESGEKPVFLYPHHYFVYFKDEALVCLTFYSLHENSDTDRALYQRIAESLTVGSSWTK